MITRRVNITCVCKTKPEKRLLASFSRAPKAVSSHGCKPYFKTFTLVWRTKFFISNNPQEFENRIICLCI